MKLRLLLKLYVGVLLCSVTSFLHANETESATIVLFGDSITVGFNANFRDRFADGTTERGCPTIYLKNILLNEEDRDADQDCPTSVFSSSILDANESVRDVVVANWGIGGSTTDTGAARIRSNLNETRRDFPADNYYVLIIYGTNDFDLEISTAVTRFNTQLMIQEARSAGFTPIIGTITPRDDRDIQPYNEQIVKGARAEGAPVVDLFARFIAQPGGWRTIVQQEVGVNSGNLVRFHPTDQGYLIIAETWFDRFLRAEIDPIVPEPELINIVPMLDILLND